MASLSHRMLKGFTWTAADRFFSQIVVFVIGLVLARIVSPSEYGILGILMVFINVSSVFIDSGLGSSLIYYNNLEEKDLRTTFTINLMVSAILVTVVVALSSVVARFYEIDDLDTYLCAISVTILVNAFIVVPTAILKVRLAFKSLAIANITASTISGIMAIVLALNGFGVWSLIFQVIARSIIQVLIITFSSRWWPKLLLCVESLKKLYRYAINLLTASCITKVTEEGISFFLGKTFSPYSLGIYTRATQFSTLPSTSIGSIIISVLFPSLALVKDDERKFSRIYNLVIRIMGMVSIPMFIILAVISEPMIRIILTDKWIEVVPILQILCLGRILFPISNVTEQAINAKGRSGSFLKQQIWKMIVKAGLIIPSLFINIYAVAIADALSSFLTYFITTYFSRQILNIKIIDQLKDIGVYVLVAFLAGCIAYMSLNFLQSPYLQLIIAIFLFAIIYLPVVIFYKRKENFEYLHSLKK